MAKNIPSALMEHMRGDAQTLCTLWKIVREDSHIFTFTDLDQDLVYNDGTGSHLYLASTGFTPTAIESTAQFGVDNMEMGGVLDSSTITESDLLAGLWDNAKVFIYRLNYRDLSMGHEVLKNGTLGQVKTGRNAFQAEIRGLTQALQQQNGYAVLPTCAARFCDTKCKLKIADFTHTGTVVSVSTQQTFVTDLTQGVGVFANGWLRFTSGANNNVKQGIKFFSGRPVYANQSYTIPLTTNTVTPPIPSGSVFGRDHGVVDSDGLTYKLQESAASQGDYSIGTGGVYHFNKADVGKTVTIKYATTSYSGSTAGQIDLQLEMPFTIQVGDTFAAVEGCDKLPKTCHDRFDNIVNNRSFPHLPGRDRLLSGKGA